MQKTTRKVPFHLNILSVLSILLLGATGSIIWFNYDRSHVVTIESAWNLMEEKSKTIFERMDGVYSPIMALTDVAAANPVLAADVVLDQDHPAQAYLLATLRASSDIYAVLVGFENGDFYEAANFKLHSKLIDKLGAPAQTHFGIKRIAENGQGQRMAQWFFLDEMGQPLGQNKPEPARYDPRQRPWYKNAMAAKQTVKSNLYIYAFLQQPGVTFSRQFSNAGKRGVVGMDVTLSSISDFLRRQQISQEGEVFSVNAKGALTAHPDASKAMVMGKSDDGKPKLVPARLQDLNDPLVRWIDSLLKNKTRGGRSFNQAHTFIVEIEGEKHLGTLSPVPGDFGQQEYLALTAPLRQFIGPIQSVLEQSLIISALIVVLMFPLSYWIAVRIARSIKALTRETEKISRFELEDPVDVVSNIEEIDALADAIGSMKSTLGTFGRYAPKALVRQLMQSDSEVALGGQRQPLTLMFTDVASFTDMAEGMPPEQLMKKVSDYFEELGGAVLEHEGTIDKFIGDALMAFWNAPNDVADHTFKGCLSALESQYRMGVLNARWKADGQSIMFTRFGLHTDDMVVGNVGSSDRMDYTVMGAAVNLTARLEGLNKYYGTAILISESVRVACGDRFLVRSVDQVMAKGTSIPVKVYELLGLLNEGPDHLKVTADQVARCARWEVAKQSYLNQRWDEASTGFAALLNEDPADALAEIYVKRCETYRAEPPPVDWDGVCRFSTK
ncbi:adenylate/guanylate cyclase domain-containing protein [Magnetococcus sp. PR-3]|uniref:adenylate/guanylate cyclase domain-containing protein n=1 Tax=Magnetococcus sp. PR-3 TaxID=3120355 RepID=UPI002FCE5D89